MDWIGSLVRAGHLLGAIVWFGGAIAMNVVVIPGVFAQPLATWRAVGRTVTLGFERVAIPAALLTAVTGFLLGTAFGPIHEFGDLSTPFGVGWLAAIGLVAALFVTGARVSSPAMRRLWFDDSLWLPAADGSPSPATGVAIARVRRGLRIELGGMAAAFVLMEVLRTLPS